MTLYQIIVFFLVPLLTVLIPIYLGQRYGLFIHKKFGENKNVPIGSVVAAAFGLVAFMLAFTFQMVDNRYASRKDLLLQEVTKTRSCYLRSGLLPDSIANPAKTKLKEFVDLRVLAYDQPARLKYSIKRSQEILDTLWFYSEKMNRFDRSSEAYSLYASSVNELNEVFYQRITVTLHYRIPQPILWILGIITFFSMLLLGYEFGMSGKINFTLNLVLAITFASVMWLILVLDRPESGIARLNQQPVIDLQLELSRK